MPPNLIQRLVTPIDAQPPQAIPTNRFETSPKDCLAEALAQLNTICSYGCILQKHDVFPFYLSSHLQFIHLIFYYLFIDMI